MGKTNIANIVKKITQLSQEDRKYLSRLLSKIENNESGGGEVPKNVLTYTPQELTEAQQMQTRKNQGLYYKNSYEEGSITWDGNTTGLEHIDLGPIPLFKVAEGSIIPIDKVTYYHLFEEEDAKEFDQKVDVSAAIDSGILYVFGGESCFCVMAQDVVVMDSSSEYYAFNGANGIYFTENLSSVYYDNFDIVDKVPVEYLPQLVVEFSKNSNSDNNSYETNGITVDSIINALQSGVRVIGKLNYVQENEDGDIRETYVTQLVSADIDHLVATFCFIGREVYGEFTSGSYPLSTGADTYGFIVCYVTINSYGDIEVTRSAVPIWYYYETNA